MATIAPEILDGEVKRDTRGRRITPAPRRAELVAAYRSSGQTMAQFARREGIRATTLAKWVFLSDRKPATAAVQFTEMKLGPATTSGWAVEVAMPNGLVVRAASGGHLSELLALIRS
jgi:transposase-like protein